MSPSVSLLLITYITEKQLLTAVLYEAAISFEPWVTSDVYGLAQQVKNEIIERHLINHNEIVHTDNIKIISSIEL